MSSASANSQSVESATSPPPTTTSPETSSTPTSTQPSSSPATSTNAGTTSHSTTSSSTSGSSSATTQSTSTTSSPGTTASAFVSTSGDTSLTVTAVVTVSPTSSSSATTNHTSSSNSFFSNTGAVAGVFTVVGIVVLALVIIFITNAVRRRRAQKFDRDVAEAAAEAAASSRSPFDDYSYGNAAANTGGNSNGGGGGYGYSDNSHGTYQLPPLKPNEQYGMTEMSQYDPYAAGAASMAAAAAVGRSRSRKESEPGAPGIAGVGAGTLVREPSKRAPYNAFAGPGPLPHDLQANNGTMRSRRNQDMLEAAGLAGAAGNPPITRKPSETTQNTHFSSRSQQFGSVSSQHQPTVPGSLQPGYPVVDSYYPQRPDTLSPDPFAAAYPPVPKMTSQAPLPNPHEAMQQPPSPPLPSHQSDHTEDVGETGSPTALRSNEQRMSYQDDVDYSQGHRVLRVANE